MSLEVDGRTGDVPIPHQHEDEGYKYVNGQNTYYNPSHIQEPYAANTAGGHNQYQQPSKPEESGRRERLQVYPGSIFRWWVLFALVAVLAVAAAGVAGSVAAKRGKRLNTWYVFAFKSAVRASTLTVEVQYAYTAGPQREAQ